jgi:hypothetical protein
MNITGIHRGEPVTIVGRGPSLLKLTKADFGRGPVISLNHAILRLRMLDLDDPMYVMQKDGCVVHTSHSSVPLGCVCPNGRMIAPLEDETLILSAAESPHCFPDHQLRHIVDVEAFGLPWYTMSAPVAVRVAEVMGCSSVRMLAFDSFTRRDGRRVDGGRTISRGSRGYRIAAVQANAYAIASGLDIEWVRSI